MGALENLPRRKLSVEDFHRMGDAGILAEDDRIELIDGEMIEMAPIGALHASKVARLARILSAAVAQNAIVWTQNPIALPPRDEPQPDLSLLKPRTDDYESGLPSAADVLLVIEVSDTTLAYDRDIKAPLYARNGIPEVWILDLQGKSLAVHRDPGPEGYRHVERMAVNETLSPLLLPQVRIDLAEVWR